MCCLQYNWNYLNTINKRNKHIYDLVLNFSMKIEVIEKIAALITAAFGLVAALAWNDAIKAIFAVLFGEQGTLIAMIIYAVIVTTLAVLATVWIGRVSEKAKTIGSSEQKHLPTRKKK